MPLQLSASRPLLARSLAALAPILGALTLAGCVATGTPHSLAKMDAPGSCFLYVKTQEDGRFALVSGMGDGSGQPKGLTRPDLSAAEVDRAYAREKAILDVHPECLELLATPRAVAPATPAAPAAQG